VKFLIDASGILQVAAKEMHTGTQSTVEVQPSYGLSDLEIEHMLEESIEYAEQDFSERQLIEARTESESILRATEKSLAQKEVAIPAEERRAIEKVAASLCEAIAGRDYKLIRVRVDELNAITTPLAERIMNGALATALEGKDLDQL
jgi:molecular chaperone DnaK (HSP70)